MASYGMNIEEMRPSQKSVTAQSDDDQVSVIRREFVALTGDHFSAVVLNQLLYWTLRVKDFDLYLEEERTQGEGSDPFQHGWIYKTATDLSEETMLGASKTTMRKYLKLLIDQGWLEERGNTIEKWKKTTQYRVNIRKLESDLKAIRRQLPSVYLKAFSPALEGKHFHKHLKVVPCDNNASSIKNHLNSEKISETKFLPSKESSFEPSLESEEKSEEISKSKILPSESKFLSSETKILPSKSKNLSSKSKILPSYTYTENTTENTNREHTQRTRAREADQKNVDLKKSEKRQDLESLTTFGVSETSESPQSSASASLSQCLESALEPMAAAWKTYVGQEVRLTAERKNGLQSILKAYFQNDLSQWVQFCKRVGSSPFLMGQGARKWRVSLDWILIEENLLKVLEGNFDDPAGLDQKRAELGQTSKEQEIHSVLASIADPVWKEWCSQLDFSIESRDPVSLGELKAIANARFLEVENDRLAWIGSQDTQVLSRIEDLKFKILPVVQRTFPHVHTLRIRLIEDAPPLQSEEFASSPLQPKFTQQKGGNHAE